MWLTVWVIAGVLWWYWVSSVWGFCGWYPQMDVVGERKQTATWAMGCPSPPAECQALAASCGFALQELVWRGAAVLCDGYVQSGIVALRCRSQMHKSCAIGSDGPVMSTLKYWKGGCLLPSVLRSSLWPWAVLMLSVIGCDFTHQ